MKKLSKLKSLMGFYWRHKTTEVVYRFLDYKKEGDQVTIITDQEPLSFTIYDLHAWLENYEEIEIKNDVITIIEPKISSLTVKPSSLDQNIILKLRDVLLDNITKVQDNPQYVPQAKQIANTVNSLVNLAKIEMQINQH